MKKNFLKGLVLLLCANTAMATTITITEPVQNQGYFRNIQSISVKAETQGLSQGEYTAIFFDGKLVADGLSASIPTNDLDFGLHEVKAMVLDKDGNALAEDKKSINVVLMNNGIKLKLMKNQPKPTK